MTLGIFKRCPKSQKIIGVDFKSKVLWIFLPLTGLIALVWYLVRVIPKPIRATYPCMRVAEPLAVSFLAYLGSFFGLTYLLKKLTVKFKKQKLVWGALFILLFGLGLTVNSLVLNNQVVVAGSNFVPQDSANQPVGIAKGIFPGRVSWANNPNAVSWDGTGNWYDAKFNNQTAINNLLKANLLKISGETNQENAWDKLFKFYNLNHNKGNVGYSNNEKIAVKINLNNQYNNNKIDASPQLIYALIEELVNQAHVPQENILIYDAQRTSFAPIKNYCSAAFPRVNYNNWGTWVKKSIKYSAEVNNETNKGTWLPSEVINASYLINMAILKRHQVIAPVTLTFKNHFGTVGSPSEMHSYVMDQERGMNKYNALVDIMGSKYLEGKTVLYLLDALYTADMYNGQPRKWKLAPFNNQYPASVFASLDPVALDSVGIDFLRSEMSLWQNADNYLHEAAQAGNSPSGIRYKPDGVGLESLGVHEHWNNANEKKYSQNLGTGTGIELVKAK